MGARSELTRSKLPTRGEVLGFQHRSLSVLDAANEARERIREIPLRDRSKCNIFGAAFKGYRRWGLSESKEALYLGLHICPGAIAQLGERPLCKREVIGSIPIGSTARFVDAPFAFSADGAFVVQTPSRLRGRATATATATASAHPPTRKRGLAPETHGGHMNSNPAPADSPAPSAPVWIVDRIEEGQWAVLESPELGHVTVPLHWLPSGVHEGVALRLEHTVTSEAATLKFLVDLGGAAEQRARNLAARQRIQRGPGGDLEL